MPDQFDLHREPELVFQAINEERYAEFYDLELTGFSDDLNFYRRHCPATSKVLELGCGSGRLCRALTTDGTQVTGIDLSFPMLQRAKAQSNQAIHYLQMDMSRLCLNETFDSVICAYNTLGLLQRPETICHCLRQVSRLLSPKGKLLLHLYVADKALTKLGRTRQFQFQFIDHPQGGRIIKETLKGYSASEQLIVLEERYRVRPMQDGKGNEDLNHTLHLSALSHRQWLNLVQSIGFIVEEQFSDYDLSPYRGGNRLLLKASLSQTL
ncbi:MAG: class I SAM-dependent methyltransferase [Desulfobulbaceae bacterium]|uniref:Class I SAM-dependent methyltransferase n=1 Tax=Candidatus Desulfatifera sulfidica TaxID=2841691 RepID=A0A8J6TCC2_9BACT|nr:class I SAM-dependent methyltransferase [Candidatus Desulfatifera sulfidica]